MPGRYARLNPGWGGVNKDHRPRTATFYLFFIGAAFEITSVDKTMPSSQYGHLALKKGLWASSLFLS